MKEIAGVDIKEVASAAQAALVKAQREKLVTTLTKVYEEKDTLTAQIEKAEQTLKGQKEQLAKLTEKIAKIEGGDWSVIKDDAKGQSQVQGGGDKQDKGGKPDGGRPDQGRPEKTE